MHPIPFTGRHSELHFLRTQLHLTRESGTRLVLISAPSGAGKTALVNHFLQTFADLLHIAGRGWDNRAAFPFQPLREAVRQLVEKQPHLSPNHPALIPFRDYLHPFLHPREEGRFFVAGVAPIATQNRHRRLRPIIGRLFLGHRPLN